MPSRTARQRWRVLLAVAFLCAGCQSSSALMRYSYPVDACRLPEPASLALLVPGTVEIPENAVKPPDTTTLPDARPGGDNEQSICRKFFARDLGGGKPDTQDYRIVTLIAIRYTESDDSAVTAKVQKLMTAELADHSGVRLLSGVGDEAGVTDNWGTARSGNVVLVLSLVDAGTEAALIQPPAVDDVQRVAGDLVNNLKQLYKG